MSSSYPVRVYTGSAGSKSRFRFNQEYVIKMFLKFNDFSKSCLTSTEHSLKSFVVELKHVIYSSNKGEKVVRLRLHSTKGFLEESVTGLINKKLPKELLLRVFSYLDIVSLCRCAQASRAWNILALDGSNWQHVNLFDFQKRCQGMYNIIQRVKISDNYSTHVIQSLSCRCGGFLKYLDVQGCQGIEDVALKTFSDQCRNIETLILRDCNKITNKTCDSLSSTANRLVHLDLESCVEINDHGLMKIGKGCNKLEHLSISWCRNVTSTGVTAISRGCPSLKCFLARGCVNLRDEGIQSIASNCAHLQKLVLQSCVGLTDNCIKLVGDHCKQLTFLNVSDVEALTDQTLKYIGDGCHELKTLEAARCSQFTDVGFSTLARGCHELQRLDLEECILISDNTLHSLSYNCPRIVNLTLSHCEQITDEGIRHIAGGPCAIEHLQIIELDNCPSISDTSLDHLMHCQALQRIELYDCHLITRSGIRRLKSRLPNVRVQAYFAPVTPPPTTMTSRRRSCRCCSIL